MFMDGLGHTTDTVRLYLREMGNILLLSREEEVALAKRIERGCYSCFFAAVYHPVSR